MKDHQLPWPEGEVRLLALEKIDQRLHRYRLAQPRLEKSMAESLERYGQISPIVICVLEEEYVLIDGFKRLRAARTLQGVSHLSARRMDVDEQGAKAAVYNLNRIGQRPLELEESWIVHALVREDGLSQVEATQLQSCDREPLESGFRRLIKEARLVADISEDFLRELKLP